MEGQMIMVGVQRVEIIGLYLHLFTYFGPVVVPMTEKQ